MDTMNIPSVDLVSTLRTAPKNGAPSSSDYNDTMREILADLGSLSEAINSAVIPVINTLPSMAAEGLEGRTIYASLDPDKTPLFYSESAKKFFTVADVLQNLHTLIAQSNNQLTDVMGRIVALQSSLATTSHNDVINAVQGFTDQIRQVSYSLSSLTRAVDAHAETLAKTQTMRVEETVSAGGTKVLEVSWPVAFPDDSYTVVLSVEGADGRAWFTKTGTGAGVAVTISSAEETEKIFTIHLIAKAD